MHQIVIYIAKYLVFIPPVVWLVLLWRLPKNQRVQFLIFSAVSAVITAALVKVATTVHQDPRPFVRDHVYPYFTSSIDNGFPSDHTALSSLLAFIVLRYNRLWGVVLTVLALCIGTARVISGVHHGQDIAGGIIIAVIGVSTAWLLEKLYGKIVAKRQTPTT